MSPGAARDDRKNSSLSIARWWWWWRDSSDSSVMCVRACEFTSDCANAMVVVAVAAVSWKAQVHAETSVDRLCCYRMW